jgi:FAD/FMN-containing dehydrogenase
MNRPERIESAVAAPAHDIDGLLNELHDVPRETERASVRRRSRDYFWYSPILNKQLHGLAADVILMPRDETDVVRIAAACAKRRIPITPRGGATGNYGQAVPLKGGVLLDMNGLNKVLWHRPGVVRTQAGAMMHEIDYVTRPAGWELRLHPSTKRMATIGGFVAGGSGGVGGIAYGGLREPGNVMAARIVTVEETPRVIELRADAAQKINRAYGTTGIITELEMPLAPAWRWIDLIVACDDFDAAFKVGNDIAHADGVVKKLVTLLDWPIPAHFPALKSHCPEGKPVLICMIAEPWVEYVKAVIGARGSVTYEQVSDDSPGSTPLYEYTWNHTTLQWLKTDRSITYLQNLYPQDRLEESVRQMRALFGDEVLLHLEFIRFAGKLSCSALPIVRYTTDERLWEIINQHEANGVMIANPHVVTLEEGSRHKWVDADQLNFKHQIDPHGLLNPGKMKSFVSK